MLFVIEAYKLVSRTLQGASEFSVSRRHITALIGDETKRLNLRSKILVCYCPDKISLRLLSKNNYYDSNIF